LREGKAFEICKRRERGREEKGERHNILKDRKMFLL
jgi:hypothetical protein